MNNEVVLGQCENMENQKNLAQMTKSFVTLNTLQSICFCGLAKDQDVKNVVHQEQ